MEKLRLNDLHSIGLIQKESHCLSGFFKVKKRLMIFHQALNR